MASNLFASINQDDAALLRGPYPSREAAAAAIAASPYPNNLLIHPSNRLPGQFYLSFFQSPRFAPRSPSDPAWQ